MKFLELTEKDLDLYERLVKPHCLEEDFITPAEYKDYLHTLACFRSWFLVDESPGNRRVGWCAAGDPSETMPGAVHFFGGVILPPFRGRGLSRLLYAHRFSVFPGRDFTMSVQPRNVIALNLALTHGFRPFLYREPWIELLKRHPLSEPETRDAETSAPAPVRR
ncbi:MAG: hypothetical protein WB783_20080 [Arenicellales bacterium]